MLSSVLLMKLGGVVVVSFGFAVTFEVPANELVVFSAIALTTLTIKTIKVNLSFIAVDFLRYFFCSDSTQSFYIKGAKDLELVLNAQQQCSL